MERINGSAVCSIPTFCINEKAMSVAKKQVAVVRAQPKIAVVHALPPFPLPTVAKNPSSPCESDFWDVRVTHGVDESMTFMCQVGTVECPYCIVFSSRLTLQCHSILFWL